MSEQFGLEPITTLRALDRTSDPERRERLVRAIMERVGPELRRRAARRGAFASLGAIARPAVAAAALIMVASGVAIGTVAGRDSFTPRVLADAEGTRVAERVAATWVMEERRPSVEDLLSALHEGAR